MELVAIQQDRVIAHLGFLLNENPRKKHVASFAIAVHPEGKGTEGRDQVCLFKQGKCCHSYKVARFNP